MAIGPLGEKTGPLGGPPAGMRLAVSSVVGVVAAAVAALLGGAWAIDVSLGWCGLALVVLAWTWSIVGPMDADETARHARADDFSRRGSWLILVSASVASLVAVAFTLVEAGRDHGTGKALLIGLVVLTVTLAWATVHTVFMLRYGDLYYDDPVGGIDFNADAHPDYRDFAYVAVTIGMTFQVSDTNIVSKAIRRTATRHALVSFLFGAVIFAVTINVVAGLLSR